ncbi:MAG: aldose 1-epimerase family protein [Nakamurella sp.]
MNITAEVATGEWMLTAGPYRCVVSPVGATIRALTVHGRDLVVPFGPGEIRPLYRGALIAPWPNRIRDGRYTFAGIEQQAGINEVARGTALHGLVQWIRWQPLTVADDRVVLTHDLVPQDGYPFPLRLQVTYALSADGLVGTLMTTNVGPADAPFGCCPHPYLVAGDGPLDSWELTAPVATRLEVDDRLLPTELVPVAAVDNDFRAPALIGSREIDHCFADVDFGGADGHTATVRVTDPAHGTGVELSWGRWAPWLQIHTADRPEPENNRVGLAVEPMSCPPDAFNLPADRVPVLAAGAIHTASWTIRGI